MDWAFALLFGVNMILLVLLGLSVWLGLEDEGSKIISVLSLVFILISLAIVGTLLRLCKTRRNVEPPTGDE